MFSSYFKYYLVFFIISIIILPNLFIPIIANFENIQLSTSEKPVENYTPSISGFVWPIPGYKRISSPFGRRTSPTSGASSYHLGIDIPAPSGTSLIAPSNSIVTFIGFKGSGGYTIILKNNHLEFIYHHVSPHYLVKKGQIVMQGQVIGQVGPKYVENVPNNPYHDKRGKQTNGATTGPHLHFAIKKDGIAVNPLDYFV